MCRRGGGGTLKLTDYLTYCCVVDDVGGMIMFVGHGGWSDVLCRCVGRCVIDSVTQSDLLLHCVSVRLMTDAEKRCAGSLIAASDAHFQHFVTTHPEL